MKAPARRCSKMLKAALPAADGMKDKHPHAQPQKVYRETAGWSMLQGTATLQAVGIVQQLGGSIKGQDLLLQMSRRAP